MFPTIMVIARADAIKPLRVLTLLSAVVALVICGGVLFVFCNFCFS